MNQSNMIVPAIELVNICQQSLADILKHAAEGKEAKVTLNIANHAGPDIALTIGTQFVQPPEVPKEKCEE